MEAKELREYNKMFVFLYRNNVLSELKRKYLSDFSLNFLNRLDFLENLKSLYFKMYFKILSVHHGHSSYSN